jgi:septal ring factor EnvC (AmiA/AmiB activator)
MNMRQPTPAPADHSRAARGSAWRAGAAAAVGLLLFGALAAGGRPQNPPSPEALATRAAARIKDLQREADSLASRERTLLDELRKLEVERDLRAEELGQSTLELERVEALIDDTAARIVAFERAAESQLPDLSARMVELYKVGNGGYLRLLLSVDDLRSMGRAYRFVSGLRELDRRRVAEHQRTLADLRKAQSSLEERRGQARAAQDAVARARDAADQAVAAHEDLIRLIDSRRDLAAQLMGELETARQKLQQTLADAAQGRPAAAGAVLALPLRPFKGDLDWPVAGRVSGTFGRQVDRRLHTSVASNGVRIAAESDAPVTAIHEGQVVYASTFEGFGKLVIVDHGDVAFSLYGYLSDIDVTSGDTVARGQTLGSVGAGLDGEPGIYFELRVDGRPVDPLQWLRRK